MSTMAQPHQDEHHSQALFAPREKVYPKAVTGYYRRLKWAVLIVLLAIYYITPWIRWDRGPDAPDQAVLVDMAGRRLYFFWIEIWPQEVYYLTGLLVLGAVGLFLATSLAGRVWCGYACPQTVWTDLYMWVERRIEGDRAARIRLDKAGWSLGKLGRKLAKHAAWIVIALLTGGAWVMYFNDAPTLIADLVRFELSAKQLFFIGLFTATTYLLAGWAREQVCTYMCPWPRFQGAMLDEDSLIVTYQAWRGEPRGAKRKDQGWEARGDCIDCGECVRVCPTGIDIRDGQQLECIGCGLCIDACNNVMAKIGRPGDLILFDTLSNQLAKAEGRPPTYRLIRPRTVIYTLILLVVTAAMAASLVLRPRLDISVLRDRAPLYVTLSNGDIRNGYTFKIANMTRRERAYALTISGVPGATLSVIGVQEAEGEATAHLVARADSVASFRVYVRAPASAVTAASMPITFTVTALPDGETQRYDSVFLGPKTQ